MKSAWLGSQELPSLYSLLYSVPALGNNGFKGSHMKLALVVWGLSPLADLGRVLGDAVTRS